STGNGKVIPSSREQVLQSLDGGILAQLTVREGDRVQANQIVASTNGDSAFAGAFFTPEVEGAYYDVERNVAVRMTNLSTGEYYS
ncbi:hypothetical protein ONQ62_27245, partial [Salmonella enterica subsp. enterica serovar Virginia]|nr:hypothetical protein [Salmonella enterica subsp. enterica serovar Virginia]